MYELVDFEIHTHAHFSSVRLLLNATISLGRFTAFATISWFLSWRDGPEGEEVSQDPHGGFLGLVRRVCGGLWLGPYVAGDTLYMFG